MRIGYACKTVGVPNAGIKSCTAKYASEEKLIELIDNNLKALETMIRYNIQNEIRLFRISSDLIPFGSSPLNSVPWWDVFADQLQAIGSLIRESGMRVSMHPGQYTVLNSPDRQVVARAADDLDYHRLVLDSLGLGPEHKIVLHIGGAYGDRKTASSRFVAECERLSDTVRVRLALENDDRSFRICDVMEIGTRLNLPVIFDNLHNIVNPCDGTSGFAHWINECRKTWSAVDGCQKIHYSQQDPLRKPGAHANTICIREFMEFCAALPDKDLDVMLEVKDKNLSAVKCINCTMPERGMKALEKEWARYKYTVLERSQKDYLEICKLLSYNNQDLAVAFYDVLERSLQRPTDKGNAVHAAQHVWGYFNNAASKKEQADFALALMRFKRAETGIAPVKRLLGRLAIKYKKKYLLESYYFVL